MGELTARWRALTPQMQAILRIVTGFLFLQTGAMKLFGWPMAMPPGNELVTFSQVWFAGVLEVGGGALLILGLCTRPVAFVLCGQMAVTYFQFHYFPQHGWPMQNGGLAAVLYCFIFLFLSAAGPGAWSLDGMRRR